MPLFDEIKIEILEDGTIKSVTDVVSRANHDNAEQFLRQMADLSGGKTVREQRKDKNPHKHHHHHDGTTHSH